VLNARRTDIRPATLADVPTIVRLRARYLRMVDRPVQPVDEEPEWLVAGPGGGEPTVVVALQEFPGFVNVKHFYSDAGYRAAVDGIRTCRWLTYSIGAKGKILTFAVDERNSRFLAAVEATGMFESFGRDDSGEWILFRRSYRAVA
jgi:hypothetical protein